MGGFLSSLSGQLGRALLLGTVLPVAAAVLLFDLWVLAPVTDLASLSAAMRSQPSRPMRSGHDAAPTPSEALANLGYLKGALSGALDDATRAALVSFQIDAGLPGTKRGVHGEGHSWRTK